MESDIQRFSELVSHCISSNDRIRSEAERTLIKTFSDSFEASCEKILLTEACEEDLLFIGLCLFFQAFLKKYYPALDKKLSPDHSGKLIDKLVQIALSKSKRSQKRHLAFLIGELLLIMNKECTQIDPVIEGKLWTDLFVLLNALRPSLKYDASQIVQSSGPKLIEAFKNTDKNDHQLGLLIGEIIADMCLTIDGKSLCPFAKFIYGLLSKTEIFNEDPSIFDGLLDIIAEIVENEPLLFSGILELCCRDINKITDHTKLDLRQKFAYLNNIVIAMSANTEVLEDSGSEHIKTIIDAVVTLMHQNFSTLGDWTSNEDDFDEEEALMFEPLHLLDLLLQFFQKQGSLKMISHGVSELMMRGSTNEDYKLIAFLMLSQVGEYISSFSDINPVVNLTLDNCSHKNPKIRFSCFHCVGQLSYDMKPSFHQNYGEIALPHLIVGMKDPIYTVSIKAIAALTTFLTGSSPDIVVNFIGDIYSNISELISLPSTKIQRLSLNCLKALVSSTKDLFSPFFEVTVDKLLEKAEESIDPRDLDETELHAMYFETASCIIRDCKSPSAVRFEPRIMSLLLANQNSLEDTEDTRIPIIFDSWIAILERIQCIPENPRNSLMRLIESGMSTVIDIQDSPENDQNIDESQINYSIMTRSLTLLSKLAINQFGTQLPNIEKYIKYCLNSISNLVYSSVRLAATEALPHLLCSIKHSGQDPTKTTIIGLAKIIVKVVLFSCTLELVPSIICKKLECIAEILHLIPPKSFSSEEINSGYKTILQIMKRMKIEFTLLGAENGTRKSNAFIGADEEGDEKPEPNIISPDELVYVGVGSVISAFVKTNPQNSAQVALHLLKNIALPILSIPLPKVYSASLQKFSLNSAVDYLENYNLNGIESEEQKLYDILTNSCYSPHWVVKHAAITGIGSFAASLGDNFIPYTKETFDILYDLQNQRKSEDEISVRLLREILLLTWGNVLQVLFKHLDSPMEVSIVRENTEIWLHSMPEEFEEEEGKKQYSFMIWLLENYFSSFLSESQAGIMKFLKVAIEIYRSKYSSDELNTRIEQLIIKISNNPSSKSIIKQLHESLPLQDRKKLEMCVSIQQQ